MTSLHSLAATAIAGIALLAACSPSAQPKPTPEAIAVTTYHPTVRGEGEAWASGIVSAKQTAHISTRQMGFVDRIYVTQGDRVSRGQLLVTINSDDLRARRAQAQAMVREAEAAQRNAQRDQERFQNLHQQQSVSDKELENTQLRATSATARLQVARQSLREVEAMMRYTSIRAPFDGVVTQKLMDEGSTAAPGAPILTIEQTGDLDIKASVPESYVGLVALGKRVTVEIKSTGQQFAGTVTELSPSAEATGGQYALRVGLGSTDKSRLKAGMYAAIRIPTARTQGPRTIWVETASIVRRDQLTGVYVATADSTAMLRWVRLGQTDGTYTEVTAGLSPTDRIIRHRGIKLHNGSRITLTQ